MPIPLVHVADAELTGDEVRLPGGDLHHLTRVLRLRDGSGLVVGDGRGGQRPAVLDGERARFTGDLLRRPAPRPPLHVIQALPKGRKMDGIVQALVELGVEQIRPVESDQAVVRLGTAKRERAVVRWEAVARAAAGQSRRWWLAGVEPVTAAEDAFTDVAGTGLLLHPGGGRSLGEVLGHERPLEGPLTLAVGPEGGWSEREVRLAAAAGMSVVTLGTTVLRTEHAAFAACAAVAYATGRFGGATGTLRGT